MIRQRAVSARKCERTERDLLKQPVFEKSNDVWIEDINSVRKKYKITGHLSIQSAIIQTAVKKIEAFFDCNITK